LKIYKASAEKFSGGKEGNWKKNWKITKKQYWKIALF